MDLNDENILLLNEVCGHINLNKTFLLLSSLNIGGNLTIFEHLLSICLDSHTDVLDFEDLLWQEQPGYMKINSFLRMYVPPILVVIGTIGNLFSLIILARYRSKVKTYTYLAVLAAMDILVLYVGLLRIWLSIFFIDIPSISSLLCKSISFLGYVSSDLSVWLIVAVTMERFVAVYFPLRASRIFTTSRVRLIILGIALVICAANLHVLWTLDLRHTRQNNSNVTLCKPLPAFQSLMVTIWPWVDAAMYSFIPFVVITVFNILLIKRISEARNMRKHLQQYTVRRKSSTCSGNTNAKSFENSKRLTRMLIAVSFTFLVTTLPVNVFHIVSPVLGPDDKTMELGEYIESFALFSLLRTIAEMLMYLNHSINFFLYCVTGKQFRYQFMQLICMGCGLKFSKVKSLISYRSRSKYSLTNESPV